MPEAVHGVLGDEFERIHEGKDHAAERTDGAPSLAEGAPVKDLEAISLLPRPQPRDRDPRVDLDQSIPMSVLANGDPAALLVVERLDPALDEIDDHGPPRIIPSARRGASPAPGSRTGRLLRFRLHGWLLVHAAPERLTLEPVTGNDQDDHHNRFDPERRVISEVPSLLPHDSQDRGRDPGRMITHIDRLADLDDVGLDRRAGLPQD